MFLRHGDALGEALRTGRGHVFSTPSPILPLCSGSSWELSAFQLVLGACLL